MASWSAFHSKAALSSGEGGTSPQRGSLSSLLLPSWRSLDRAFVQLHYIQQVLRLRTCEEEEYRNSSSSSYCWCNSLAVNAERATLASNQPGAQKVLESKLRTEYIDIRCGYCCNWRPANLLHAVDTNGNVMMLVLLMSHAVHCS